MGLISLSKKSKAIDAWQKVPTKNMSSKWAMSFDHARKFQRNSTDKIWMNDPLKAWNQKKLHVCDIENEEIPSHLGFFDVVGNSIEFRQIFHQALGISHLKSGKFPRSMGNVPQRLSLWSQKKDSKEKSHVVPLFHRVKSQKNTRKLWM